MVLLFLPGPTPAQKEGASPVPDEAQTLRDLNETLKRINQSAADVFHEVNRHAPAPLSRQDMMDEYVMDPWASAYPAAAPFDPALIQSLKTGPLLPPRKKWLDHSTDAMSKSIAILQDEMRQVSVPAQAPQAVADSFKAEETVLNDTAGKIKQQFDQLTKLTAGPDFDNNEIAKIAREIGSETKGMNETRKRLLKLLLKSSN